MWGRRGCALGGRSSRRVSALGVVLWGLATVMAACGGGESDGDGGTPVNSAPVADAGRTQRVMIPAPEVTLDGSRSSDADGDSLTYRWTLATPPGSVAVLRGETTVSPTFGAATPGTYVASLVVNDGKQDSAPSAVTITVWAPPPFADAGGAQVVVPGSRVTLNGSGSRPYLGTSLTYRWELTARPSGSAAALVGATTVAPTFVADLPGTYVASLVVNDGQDSLPSSVTITAAPAAALSRPVADAGPAQNVTAGALVTLDGSRSRAAGGGPLTYGWSLRTPQGSAAVLTGATTARPTFTPDLAGTYLASLWVTDERLYRGYAEVFISVAPPATSCTSGGGGNATTLPAEPTLKVQVQLVKVFRFSWADVPGATEYRLLEDPDSASGYRQVASIAPGVCSHELQVSLPLRVNASYVLQACNAAGCASSAVATVTRAALNHGVGTFSASNGSFNDQFGSVALSADGDTLAVGASGESSGATGINGDQLDTSKPRSGAVYVFARQGGRWAQQAYVKAGNTEALAGFGVALALSADGRTLAVGAPVESGGAGAAYLYVRNGTTWAQQARLQASNPGATDLFGLALALSGDGNTLAVGARNEDGGSTGVEGDQADNSAPESGAVYVFTRSGTAWGQQAYVKASNTGAGDGFGWALALSGDGSTLAVGAPGEGSSATGINGDQADNSADSSGAVYVYSRTGAAWAHQAYVKASNTGKYDFFGGALTLSADGATLAVGAPYEASSATGVGGDQGDNSAPASGAVYVYTRVGITWTQQAYVKASNAQASDVFGEALALSGNGATMAVGARYEDSGATGINGDQSDNSAAASGAVYLFGRSGASWTQKAYVKALSVAAPGSYARDAFGTSVAISTNGETLAVGSIQLGTGEIAGTPLSGTAYVY